MKRIKSLLLLSTIVVAAIASAQEKIIIAHRGASGYLPEHTLQAKVLAHAQGADYIEQDVVMTRDGELVVLHDLTLDRISNVGEVFPGRAREDGMHYVIDFTLSELRRLRITETPDPAMPAQPLHADRFPVQQSRFGIHTLGEELELIQGLNKTLAREAGIYVELKSPWFHHMEGKDLAAAVLKELKTYGYDSRDDRVYLQCFDYNELLRVKRELFDDLAVDLKLVQLIAANSWGETYTITPDGGRESFDYDWMHGREGLQLLAETVDGVGPQYSMLLDEESGAVFNAFVSHAHAAGLEVHPYTFRADRLPPYVESFETLIELFLHEGDIDGLFTDFPDRAIKVRDSR